METTGSHPATGAVKRHEVFISHSASDRHVALAIALGLEERGLRCWMAPRDIVPGTPWDAAISAAIRASHSIVLVFSNQSNVSDHVANEVRVALRAGVPVIPFRIEDAPLSDVLAYHISGAHWLDALTPPLDQHIQELGRAVESLTSRSRTAGGEDRVSREAPPPADVASQPDEERINPVSTELSTPTAVNKPEFPLAEVQEESVPPSVSLAESEIHSPPAPETNRSIRRRDVFAVAGLALATMAVVVVVNGFRLLSSRDGARQPVKTEQPVSAAEHNTRACDAGGMNACAQLAEMYIFGPGVEQNFSRALSLNQRACDGGSAKGCAGLGEMYMNLRGVPKDTDRAIPLLRRGCEGGSAQGCHTLGWAYLKGDGVQRDSARGLALLQRGCDLGGLSTCRVLGSHYAWGENAGIRDYARAIPLYERACNGGDVDGCVDLANLYDVGRGVARDSIRADSLLNLACDRGRENACTVLQRYR